MNTETPVRVPDAESIESAQLTRYTAWLQKARGLEFADYNALWTWSVEDLEGFWSSLWDYFDVEAEAPYEQVISHRDMPGAEWFPGATINYTRQVFKQATNSRPAILHGDESGFRREVSWGEFEQEVAGMAATLSTLGVASGDRVVAYLPNIPETAIAFHACASIGAIWSVCSPDMGASSVLDRFKQIEPKVLIACTESRYGGRVHDRSETITSLLSELPTVEHLITVGDVEKTDVGANVASSHWGQAVDGEATLNPIFVPFDHPLWVVYSSGTTGLPKPIVHSHGGVMLEATKFAVLHDDLGPDDVFFWYSSSGWIMWNIQMAGLLSGATICTFDGSPAGAGPEPDMGSLWRLCAEWQVTFFGAGAAFHSGSQKAGVAVQNELGPSSRVRAIGSTGSPLPPDTEQWLYDSVGNNVWVTPICGGTDIASAFIGGNAALPSYLGEMQCRCLGARLEAWTENGDAVIDEVGELVCTVPMPSMPLRFWNDDGDVRYQSSYFDIYPGVWRHGDWMRVTDRPGAHGVIIYGRSDATINRHGLRIGTAELYRAVESVDEVLDSLIVDLEYLGRESFMPLFVKLRDGVSLDEPLVGRINTSIRKAVSGRFVPNEIHAVTAVPTTITGKKLELPIKKLLLGQAADKVLNRDAMANPESIEWFVEYSRTMKNAAD